MIFFCFFFIQLYSLNIFQTTGENNTLDIYIGISLGGIWIFHRNGQNLSVDPDKNSKTTFQRKLYLNFDWLEIENLCFSKHILCVAVRKSISLNSKDKSRVKYKFKMNDRKSYFAFSLASEHHKFYMKLRNSFISIKTLSDEFNIPLTSLQRQNNLQTMTPLEEKDELNKNHSESKSKSEPILSNEKPDKSQNKPKTVRSLKKSMLNDNKLLKLKNKFLKRSKSSAEIKPTSTNIIETKEENQNKENECPRVIVVETVPKTHTLNRNKVKMGTRVFSTQFLNKSIDNIYANPMDLYAIDIQGQDYGPSGVKHSFKGIDDDGISMKSTSVGSIYFSNKIEKIDENDEVPCVVRKHLMFNKLHNDHFVNRNLYSIFRL